MSLPDPCTTLAATLLSDFQDWLEAIELPNRANEDAEAVP
jgi:hypothetical protein